MPLRKPGTGAITTLPAVFVAVFVAVAVAAATLAGCGGRGVKRTSGKASASDVSSAAPATTTSAGSVDISRLGDIRTDFPSGFLVEVHPARAVGGGDLQTSELVDLAGALINPVECRSVVIPPYVDAPAGSTATEIRAVGTDRAGVQVVALRTPTPMAATPPPAICKMEILISGPPDVAGTAEHIHAPDIDGADTTALKLAHGEHNPQYMYSAVLDPETVVVVLGTADANRNPQQWLPEILVKAVAALRR